ncbi:hypothetical protein [Pseudomonas sp.]|uniref:hypothetical protein n=1 Tax=Pseudomonas sp. TaxID=306 RepID=UPI003264EE1D
MSDITRTAIQAPITAAMSSSIARLQFYNIAQGLLQDFDRVTAERYALQLRLNKADQRIDELTQSKNEQVALMPVERSYDVRAKQILAFNTCKQSGGDLDDALGAAYKAALRYTPHPGEQPAPGSVVLPVDPERERLIEIIEQYPNGDPLEYDAAVRKLQQ